jgi:hypothetical protein
VRARTESYCASPGLRAIRPADPQTPVASAEFLYRKGSGRIFVVVEIPSQSRFVRQGVELEPADIRNDSRRIGR